MPRSAASNRLVTRDMGKSGSFDGTSTHCTVPITPSLTAFSYAFWTKPGTKLTTNARILDYSDSGPINGFTFVLSLSGSRFAFAPTFLNNLGNVGSFASYTAVPGEWSHHVLTYEPDNMKWYINGTLFGTDTSGTMTAPTQTLTIGRRSAAATNPYSGLIEDFVFVNDRAMTATEVATLYTSGQSPSDTTCHIRFNDNVNDETANGNNLTASNITYLADTPASTRSAASSRSTVANLVTNGDFEYAPAFTAATTSSNVYINGTAAGTTTANTYGWRTNYTNSCSAQFDSAEKANGNYSLKLSTTGTNAIAQAQYYSPPSTSTTAYFELLPSTSYTITFKMKTNYVSGVGRGAFLRHTQYSGDKVAGTGTDSTYINTTTNWTDYSISFTTASTARYGLIRLFTWGQDSSATLIMDAWFDDIVLTKTTPDARTTA